MEVLKSAATMALFVAVIFSCIFGEIESLSIDQAGIIAGGFDQLNPTCYVADCLSSATPNCAFLTSQDVNSIASNFAIYKNCMHQPVCSVQMDPFRLAAFSQEIPVPGYNGVCVVSGTAVELLHTSAFQFSFTSSQPTPGVIVYDMPLTLITSWTEVAFQCTPWSLALLLAEILAGNLNALINLVLFLAGLLQLPPAISGGITANVQRTGILRINVSNEITTSLISNPITVSEITVSTTNGQSYVPAIKTAAEDLIESAAIANAAMSIAMNQCQMWIQATKQKCGL